MPADEKTSLSFSAVYWEKDILMLLHQLFREFDPQLNLE